MPRKIPPVRVPNGCKYCFQCQSVKQLTDFATDRSKPDGLRPMCRPCDNARRTKADNTPARLAERHAARDALRMRRMAAAAAKRHAIYAARIAAREAFSAAASAAAAAGAAPSALPSPYLQMRHGRPHESQT